MLLKLVDQPEVALNILDEDSVNNWIRMSSVARYEVSHHLEDKTANNDQAIPPKVITLTATTLDSDNEAYERIIAKNDAGLTDELPRFVVYSRVGGCILGVWIQDAWEIQTEVCQLELRYYPDGGFCIAALTEVDQALITEAAINQDNEISRTSPFEIDFDSSDATYRCMFADEESANHFYIQLERVSQLEVQRTKTAVTPMKPNDEPPTIITNDDDNSDSNSNKGSASDLSESGDSGFASSSSALAETDTEEFDFPTTPQSKEEVVPALVVSRRASTLNTSSFTTPVSALPRTSSLDPKGGCYISHIRRKEGDRFTHKRAASMPVETSSVLLAPPQMSKPNRVSLEVASILGGRRTLLYTPCKIYLLTDHTSWTFLGKTMLEVSTNLKNSTQIQIKASGLKKGRKPFELNILSPLATVELAQKRINLTVLGEDKLSSVYCIRIKDPENLALAYKLLSLYAEKSNAK
ncbi:hypothetical protein BDF22DRAFT_26764 [Syncephalis plumigaleata]|nr:hypothetical protein BDF22DRAFT_26764 [Syncephalis plumigaleata]